jgi:hypothetical protein
MSIGPLAQLIHRAPPSLQDTGQIRASPADASSAVPARPADPLVDRPVRQVGNGPAALSDDDDRVPDFSQVRVSLVVPDPTLRKLVGQVMHRVDGVSLADAVAAAVASSPAVAASMAERLAASTVARHAFRSTDEASAEPAVAPLMDVHRVE